MRLKGVTLKKCKFAQKIEALRFIYSFLISFTGFILKIIALFSGKIKLFVNGRKTVFTDLELFLDQNNTPNIWIHVASLGEFEQGLPVMEQLKTEFPEYQLLLTFFSPSGYEVKKGNTIADFTCYLPLDTVTNANRFVNLVNPQIAIFVKYEIWPNYLNALKNNNIPTFLISAIFHKRHIYFKKHGTFMRNSLATLSHIFVQNSTSQERLKSIGFNQVSISGDTRFDRVLSITQRNNSLPFMDAFKNEQNCIVFGSSWPEDETIYLDYINNSKSPIKFVIAPHNIKPVHIESLAHGITKKWICYSDIDDKNLADFEVLIIDTIGLLTKIYSYADIAYVGGGFATGLHNTLEPAVFGIPILIGPQFNGFQEAEDLVAKKGALVIQNQYDFANILNQLLASSDFLNATGYINAHYVKENSGATLKIMSYLRKTLKNTTLHIKQ